MPDSWQYIGLASLLLLITASSTSASNLGSPTNLRTVPITGGVDWSTARSFNIEGVVTYLSVVNVSRANNSYITENQVHVQGFDHVTGTLIYQLYFVCFSVGSQIQHHVHSINNTHAAFCCNALTERNTPQARVYFFDPTTGAVHWIAESLAYSAIGSISFVGVLNNVTQKFLLVPESGEGDTFVIDLTNRTVITVVIQEFGETGGYYPYTLDNFGNTLTVNTVQGLYNQQPFFQLTAFQQLVGSLTSASSWDTLLPSALNTVVTMSSWVWPSRSSTTSATQFVAVLAAFGILNPNKEQPFFGNSLVLSNFTLLLVNTQNGSIAATLPLLSIPDGMVLDSQRPLLAHAHFHHPVGSGGQSTTVLHLKNMLHTESTSSGVKHTHFCGSVGIEFGGAWGARERWSEMVVGECEWHQQQGEERGWFVSQSSSGGMGSAPTARSVNVATGITNCSVTGIPQLKEGTSDIPSTWSVAYPDKFTAVALGDLLLLQGHDNGVPRRFVGIKECSAQFTFDAGGVVDLEQVTRFGDTLVVPTQLSATKGHLTFVNASDIIPPPVADRADDGDGHRRIYIIIGIVAVAAVVVAAGLVALVRGEKRADAVADPEAEFLNDVSPQS